MKKVISTILALSLIISTPLSVFANSTKNIPSNSPENEMAKINNIINKLDPYVKYNSAINEYFIDAKKLPKTITKSEIRIANKIISNTNQNNLIKPSAHNTTVKAKKKGPDLYRYRFGLGGNR
ncbi:MAG: hypothetical protein SOR72_00010 [Hornefia sp.]|nr:hypothetical protein [Hornefia sp.]